MQRPGLFDLCAVVIVLIALFLPPREVKVEPLYSSADANDLRAVAQAQARLLARLDDHRAVTDLTDALARLGLHHDALRVAGDAAGRDGTEHWRSLLAASSAHAERIEVELAYDWANKALQACDRDPSGCPGHERLRIELYHASLERGLRSGVDPREYPEKFRQETVKGFPRATNPR